MNSKPPLHVALSLVLLASLTVCAGQEPSHSRTVARANAPAYVRVARDSRGTPAALETAVVRFEIPAGKFRGATVDLIAAVHVGEKAYYTELERVFDRYDAVLYELVGGADGPPAPPGSEPGVQAVGMLQRGMKDFLQLHHQLDHINYARTNFVHADMSLKEFKESMANRGESFFALFLRLMNKAMQEQGQTTTSASDLELLLALFSPNRALLVKRFMAEQFHQIDSVMNEINGPEGSTILTERNKVAMAVLARQLQQGRKRIAIFYGAAHMPDFESRLAQDYGVKRSSERWLRAWDLRAKTQRSQPRTQDAPSKSSPN